MKTILKQGLSDVELEITDEDSEDGGIELWIWGKGNTGEEPNGIRLPLSDLIGALKGFQEKQRAEKEYHAF